MTRPWDAARIAEARARCEAQTKGPWTSSASGQHVDAMGGVVATLSTAFFSDHRHVAETIEQRQANAAGIAAARTDLPEALDEIERLRAALHAVAHDPHQSYEWHGRAESDSQRQYQIGVSDGHRCAGNTARRALGEVVDG